MIFSLYIYLYMYIKIEIVSRKEIIGDKHAKQIWYKK